MSADVIQGWFVSGRPKLMALVQPKTLAPHFLLTKTAAPAKIATRRPGHQSRHLPGGRQRCNGTALRARLQSKPCRSV